MGWARFDDCYTDHPKVVAAGNDAELLDVRAILYCSRYETDGHLPLGSIALLGRGMSPAKARAAARKLVDVGRWRLADDGWEIVDFLDYNPSHASKEAERAAARDRMSRLRNGRASRHVHANNDEPRAESSPELRSTPSRPDPEGNSSGTVSTRPVENRADDEMLRIGQTARTVLERIIDGRTKGRSIKNPRAYRARAMAELQTELDLPKLDRLIEDHPTAPIDALAGAILGEPNSLHLHRLVKAP